MINRNGGKRETSLPFSLNHHLGFHTHKSSSHLRHVLREVIRTQSLLLGRRPPSSIDEAGFLLCSPKGVLPILGQAALSIDIGEGTLSQDEEKKQTSKRTS
jgi:hypothetical protein